MKNITESEKLSIDDTIINIIQEQYKSDIRSMINFIQLNQHTIIRTEEIVNNEIWQTIYKMITQQQYSECKKYIYDVSVQFNLDKKSILTKYFNYIIENKTQLITCELLEHIENIVHHQTNNISDLIDYFLHNHKIQN